MIRIFKTLAAHTWLVSLLLVIVCGILITLARLVTPVVSDYRSELEAWAAETLKHPVSIGKISARWSGLGPQLVLKDVTLHNLESEKPALDVAQIHIAINIVRSLSSWTISPRRITVVGAKLLIRRRVDGAIAISGLESLAGGDSDSDTSAAFLLPGRISLRECEIYWKNEAIARELIRFSHIEVDLVNRGNRHLLVGKLTLPPTSDRDNGGSFHLAADLHLDEGDLRNLSGEIYAKGNNLPLVRLAKERFPKQFQMTSGQGDLELWSHWKRGRPTRLQGGLRVTDLRLSSKSDKAANPGRALESDLIEGRFRWQKYDNGWRFDMKDFVISRRGISWPESELSLLARHDSQGRSHYSAGANFLRIEDIHAIVAIWPDISPEFQQALHKIRPQADIHQFKLTYHEVDDNTAHWATSGRVDPLFTRPWMKLPAVSNMSFRFWIDQDQGSVLLEGKQAAVDLPRLFRDPHPINRLEGLVRWKKNAAGGWLIASDSLLAENSEIQTLSRLDLELPVDKSASPFINLQTAFISGDASAAQRYLPVGIMKPRLIKWLDRAFVKGELTSGSCILHGRLKEFPFHKSHSGHFEVQFTARDMTLDYWPGWPRVEKINAEVRFRNNSFDLLASEGKIFNIKIRKLHAEIESLRPTSPLRISLQSDGPVNDQLRFLAESPLKTRFAPLVKNFSGSGDASLRFNLTQPFKNSKQFSLNGVVSMDGAGLDLLTWQLPITNIQGDLIFDQANLRAKGVMGQILGSEGRVDILTPKENAMVTRLSANGTVTTDALMKQFPQAGLEHFQAQGKTAWRMQLDIPHLAAGKSAAMPFEIGSSLKGIEIDLPPPLGKEPDQTSNLLIYTDLRGDKQTPLQVNYGNIVDTSLLIGSGKSDKRELIGANIQLGGGKAQPAKPKSLEIKGHLQQLQLNDWLAHAKQNNRGKSLPPLQTLDLSADLVLLGERRFKSNRLLLQRSSQAWSGKISSDAFTGDIRIPKDLEQQSIDLRLQRLNLSYAPKQKADTEVFEPSKLILINPGDIPSLHITAEKLTVNDQLYGALELQTRRKPKSLELEMLTLDSDRLQLSASGGWSRNEWFQQTHLDLNLKSSSFGQLLSDLGIWTKMEMAPADIYSRLLWDGAPHALQLKNLNGSVSMKFGEGQLLEINPGIGRLLGLLNIGSLPRRLKLDFNDMTHKGLAFDKIEGDFKIDQGDAHTENLTIKGPAANIVVSGRYGLGKRDLDQEITVTPNISSPLSLAGFAAGPQVGAALVLAQRLVGKKIDEASRSRYWVSGTWDELKVVRMADSSAINKSNNLSLEPLN